MRSASLNKIVENHNPLVTVAIPVFQGEKYIRFAIESVLSQTFRNFELLIIDNNSNDKTKSIVLSYSDPRIIFIQNIENIGVEQNWNKCLALARGKYIKILPHDDIIDPTCLEDQVKVLNLDCDERITLVFCARKIIDSKGRLVVIRRPFMLDNGSVMSNTLIKKCIRCGTNIIGEPGAVLFRLNNAKEVGNFSSKIPYVIDLDYWIRLLAVGDGYYINKSLCSFRVSSSSWSVEIGSKQSTEFIKFISQIAKNPSNRLSKADKIIGRIMAIFNRFLRHTFYRAMIR